MQDRANLPMRTESAPLQRNDALYRARGAYNFGKGVDFRHNAPRANFPARPPLGAMATSAGAAGPNATTMPPAPPPPSSSAAGAGGVNHRGTPPTNNATEEGHKSSTTPSQQQISSEAMDGRAAGTPNRGNGTSASEANITGAYGHPSSLTLEESEEGPTRHVTAMMGGHAHHLRNSPQRPQQQQQQQQQQPSGAWSQSLSRASSGEHQPHHNINSNNGAANVGMQGANTTEQSPEHRGSEMHQHHYDPESQSRVYSVNQLLRLQNSQHPVPEAILNCARSLWKEMPEHVDEIPQNSFLRDNLFKGGNITMPSKLLVERKLHNEVMGILGKVTESNIEVMKNELTALPIRQSTEDEIRQVIHVFFNKSTRPEDSRYTPLYVQLIAHLINTIGTHERAGKMIRVEVLSQCRTTFMNAAGEAKMVEEKVAKLPDTEANLLRMQFTSKQKANIYFLSQMFLAHLVSETVVLAVLDNLLYGEGRRRRVPPDYCIVHFIELMQTCGPYLDKPFYEKTFPRYYQVMLDLSQNYPQKRIQFLLQNFLDTINNNWVPVHGPGAKLGAAAPHGRPVTTPLLAKAAGRSGAGTPALLMTSPTAVHGLGGEPRPKIPDREEFWRVMDDFFATSEIEDIVKVIANIPMPVLEAYCSQWIGRYITTYRYTQERTRLGELFEKLVSRNAFTVKNVRDALDKHIQNAIAEDLFTDQPRYFELWAVVIKNGRSIFPSVYHTKLLNALVDNRTSKEIVVKMIMDVHKVLDEPGNGSRTDQKEYNAQDRFRVLSALLRYIPPLLEAEAPAEDDESILDDVRDVDVEVNFFLTLCESYDEGRHAATMSTVLDALKKSHTNAYPLISAYFTFVRFDVDALCTSYKDVLKKLLAIRTPASLLEEVYVQWQALDCPESYYFAFVKKALATMTSTKGDPLEKLRERLRTEYGADKLLVQLDKYLK